ncbi:MAG: cyanophycin synthetase [Acidobacteriota bacterium]
MTDDGDDLDAADLSALLAEAPTFGNGPGLHRMAALVRRLEISDFLKRLDAVKITGSNGKGSTATVLAALFDELDVRQALFTSPHLLSPTERIRIDGRDLQDEEFREAWRRVDGLVPDGGRCGTFERLTAMALERAAARGVHTVVAEAGIGGRLDATRVIPGRSVGLTSLDLEHTALLGSSLELIAYDKVDLCPDGGVVVVGSRRELDLEASLLDRIEGYLAVRGVALKPVDGAARLLDVRYLDAGMVVDMELYGERLPDVDMAMAGRFQWSNAVVALLLAEQWLARHRPGVARTDLVAAWRRAVARAKAPGRFEVVGRDPLTVIDVGHTPRAARAVAALARRCLGRRPIVLVLGVSDDKDIAAIARPLLEVADAAVLTRASRRGAPVEALLELAGGLDAAAVEPVRDAVASARDLASRRGGAVLVAGGLFLGVEAKRALAVP